MERHGVHIKDTQHFIGTWKIDYQVRVFVLPYVSHLQVIMNKSKSSEFDFGK